MNLNETEFEARTILEHHLPFKIDNVLKWFSIFMAVLSGCYSSVINVSNFNEIQAVPARPMFLDFSNLFKNR